MTENKWLSHGFIHEEQALPKYCKETSSGGGESAMEGRGVDHISGAGGEDRLFDMILGGREDMYFEILCGCRVHDWNGLAALVWEPEEFDLNYGAGEFFDADDQCLDWFCR